MSGRQCLFITRQALYRVFVSPLDRPELARQLLRPRTHALPPLTAGASIRCFSHSNRHENKKPRRSNAPLDTSGLDDKDDLGYDPRYTTQHAITRSGRDRMPRDLEIKDPKIIVVDNGVSEGPLQTRFVLSKLRPEESLRMVRPYTPASKGEPESFAVCHIVDKKEAYEREKEQKKKSAAKAGGVVKVKEMELTWSISGGDIETKMRQILGFLEKGMKVNIAFGKKRRGKEVSPADAQALVAKVRSGIEEGGGKEGRKADGVVGGTYRMYVEKK